MRVRQEALKKKLFTKMRINEVLECYNKAALNKKGHYLAICNIIKLIGPFKQCNMKILFADYKTQSTSLVCEKKMVQRCNKGEEDSLIKEVSKEILIDFFNLTLNNEI